MTIQELCEELPLTPLTGTIQQDRFVQGCYMGDLLSWVMGRAREDNIWITVMGNVNAVAVAKLADISAIILCDNAPLDADAKQRAEENDITIFASPLSAYELAVAFWKLETSRGQQG